MSAELPSPFTISNPEFHFVGAPTPGANGERLTWTVGELLTNLRDFANFYLQCTHEMQAGPYHERRHAYGTREANASADQITFNAVNGMDQVRTWISERFGDELTVGTANRFVAELLRSSNGELTRSQADKIELSDAVARVLAASRTSSTTDSSQVLPVVENQLTLEELKLKVAGLPKHVGTAYLQYHAACSQIGDDVTDQAAYDTIPEDCKSEGKHPAFDTWAKSLRLARKVFGEQKNQRRNVPGQTRRNGKAMIDSGKATNG